MSPAPNSGRPGAELSEPQLVDARRAAQILSVSPRTLWGETAAGRLPAVRIGRAVRYDMGDLRAYIQQRKSAGGAA